MATPVFATLIFDDIIGLLKGVLRQNRRNFRHPSFSPATSISKSIISLELWKV
uniref:Uncharacterized protein n=3 Tax=Enterobacteriaceae TaxID=543 RepID=A0A3G1NHF4_CITFR|nr:Hypothetical protein [Citrobacter freundii]AVX51552.1 hypothetical protein [Klebsiella pneumoniae]UFD95268.1 hypothetical protein [Escherichia coli]UFD95712.1 hypothetical protein [Escherichia coli]UFD97492.1 hypothetical protein [Klebsiella pneumoniae]